MANLKAPLSVKEVEQLKSEGSHAVGGVPGLLLQVTSGGRSWIYRYTFEGLRKKIGLGPYSALSLRDAREQAQEFALRIRAGVDPSEEKKLARLEAQASIDSDDDSRAHTDSETNDESGPPAAPAVLAPSLDLQRLRSPVHPGTPRRLGQCKTRGTVAKHARSLCGASNRTAQSKRDNS